MKENIAKLGFSALAAAVGVYFNALALPLILLTVVMIIDYSTGIIKAWMGSELSSRIGIAGIIKKACYILLVAAAIAVDGVVFSTAESMGISCNGGFFGITVTVWLTVNEVISILENIAGIGVPIPEFLTKAVKKLRISIENKSDE